MAFRRVRAAAPIDERDRWLVNGARVTLADFVTLRDVEAVVRARHTGDLERVYLVARLQYGGAGSVLLSLSGSGSVVEVEIRRITRVCVPPAHSWAARTRILSRQRRDGFVMEVPAGFRVRDSNNDDERNDDERNDDDDDDAIAAE